MVKQIPRGNEKMRGGGGVWVFVREGGVLGCGHFLVYGRWGLGGGVCGLVVFECGGVRESGVWGVPHGWALALSWRNCYPLNCLLLSGCHHAREAARAQLPRLRWSGQPPRSWATTSASFGESPRSVQGVKKEKMFNRG